MTLKKFVQLECANYVDQTGICCPSERRCLIAQEKRCSYFERCLLGLSEMRGLKNAALYKSATDAYRRKIMRCGDGAVEETRRCGCGAPLLPLKRLCDKCKARNRRETKRKAMSAWRMKSVDCTGHV